MKDHLAMLVHQAATPQQGRNVLREYLQARILECLQRGGAMIPLAFQGGTALRFLYGLQRFSEDLDFALEHDRGAYDLRAWLTSTRDTLEREGYEVEVKLSDKRAVHAGLVRFSGLLHEMGLSGRRGHIVSIKVEVDTHPPAGAGLETSVVRRHVLLQLQHHDKASLLAGKLHAVLMRPYPKGRDIYDLVWYLSDPRWPPPNTVLLTNALKQTGWDGPAPTLSNWRRLVRKRLRAMDFRAIRRDVQSFLERSDESDLLTHEHLVQLLREKPR